VAWYNASWAYRKAIVIAHTDDGEQTNYQLRLLVGESSGATGEDVDCASHCQADFDDLRFTASDGTTICDYWIESITGTTPNQLATVWVKVSVAAHPDDTTIYMYYGNAGASAASSGADTFGAGNFDNFEWGSNGDHIHSNGGNVTWTSTDSATISTAQEYTGIAADTRSCKLADGATAASASCSVTPSANIAIRVRIYNSTFLGLIHGKECGATDYAAYVSISGVNIRYYTVAWADTTKDIDPDAFEFIEICNFDWTAHTYDIYYSVAGVRTLAKTGVVMSLLSAYNGLFYMIGQNNNAGEDDWVDNFLVRNWTANEPTWSSFGSEETNGWANIAKINGITNASVSKINGIAVASISKINGVAV